MNVHYFPNAPRTFMNVEIETLLGACDLAVAIEMNCRAGRGNVKNEKNGDRDESHGMRYDDFGHVGADMGYPTMHTMDGDGGGSRLHRRVVGMRACGGGGGFNHGESM